MQQLGLPDPQSERLAVQRTFVKRQRSREGRVLGKVSSMNLCRKDVVLEDCGDDGLDYFDFPFLIFIVVTMAIVLSESMVDEAFERREHLEFVRVLDDVIAEECFYACLIKG